MKTLINTIVAAKYITNHIHWPCWAATLADDPKQPANSSPITVSNDAFVIALLFFSMFIVIHYYNAVNLFLCYSYFMLILKGSNALEHFFSLYLRKQVAVI